jgi:hypothetical protein
MAIGDLAASVGLVVYPSSQDARLGNVNDNQRGDDLANHILNGKHDFKKITGQATTAQITNKAVTGDKLADTVAKTGPFVVQGAPLTLQETSATDKVQIGSDASGVRGIRLTTNQEINATAGGDVSIKAGNTATIEGASSLGESSAAFTSAVTVNAENAITLDSRAANVVLNGGSSGDLTVGTDSNGGRVYSDAVWGRTLAGPANMVVNSNGTIGRVSSSRRYKTEITDAPALERVLDIQPVTFKAARPEPGQADQVHYGVIAEDLDALGLSHLVGYDEEGRPDSVHYDRIGVALIPVVQRLVTVIAGLQSRIETLEGRA